MCKELFEPIINFFVHFPEPPPIDEQVSKFSLPDYKTFIRQDNVVSKKENKEEWELV